MDTRTCHVALLPGPGRSGPTILLKYDLLPPYPVFLPQLALRIPGRSQCVVPTSLSPSRLPPAQHRGQAGGSTL